MLDYFCYAATSEVHVTFSLASKKEKKPTIARNKANELFFLDLEDFLGGKLVDGLLVYLREAKTNYVQEYRVSRNGQSLYATSNQLFGRPGPKKPGDTMVRKISKVIL